MRQASEWRSPESAQACADYDWADWAQEFVRRSPDYARDYHATRARIAADEGDAQHDMEVLAQRWGMIFPV